MSIQGLRKIHIGSKIQRIREIRGMKQDTLAAALGVTQQAVSLIEQSENVEEDKLVKISEALGVSVEEIKNFSDEAVFNNSVHDNGTVFNYIGQYQMNPIEKIVELYERLLKEKDEVIEIYRKQRNAS